MLISGDNDLTITNTLKYHHNLKINKFQATYFDACISLIIFRFINFLILSLLKRFYDYETLSKVLRDFKNKLLTKVSEQIIVSFGKDI
jgi:hypothetical protein